MLVNFCREFLKTTVKCDTITTEGYEVDNLLKNSNNGFLAYSCIKPPVNIDFNFNCWIKINHIVIWPTIGAQKSSGFRVSVRSHSNEEFKIISSSFLKADEAGAVFCRTGGDERGIPRLMNFSTAFIRGNQMVMERIKSLRLSIVKTEKSVPAVDRIEIWGFVSGCNSKQIVREMGELMVRPVRNELYTSEQETFPQESNGDDFDDMEDSDQGKLTTSTDSLDIPESFLDPITCTMMQQPVVLPSGKVIDQSTLEKYAESQALWGRTLGDPFTGVPFTDTQRPVFASTLKAMIDKFLSENSNLLEIKAMPRVLGKNYTGKIKNNFIDLRKISANTSSSISQSCVWNNSIHNQRNKLPVPSVMRQNVHKSKTPIVAQYSKDFSRHYAPKNSLESKNIEIEQQGFGNCSRIDDNLKNDLKVVMSSIKRFNEDHKYHETIENPINICSCCDSYSYYYKFPCNHLICRKNLVSTDTNNLKCNECEIYYKSSQIERIIT